MTLLSWIKKQLNIITPSIHPAEHRRHARHMDYHRKKRVKFTEPNSASKPEAPTKPQPDTQNQNDELNGERPTVTAKQATSGPAANSRVIFSYLDEDDAPIGQSDILNGVAGEPIHFKIPDFSDYYLTEIDNFTATFDSQDQEITLHFARKEGLPVMVYAMDTDTRTILQSVQLLSGKLGKHYSVTAPGIDGYRLTSSAGQTYGNFDNQTHGIVFYYRKSNWRVVQPVTYYVKLTANHQVFGDPGGQALRTGLPANVIIKIFARIDTTDDVSWLNIGGSEWILNANLEPSDLPSYALVADITKTSRNPVRLAGTISFVPGKSIALFDQPYGNQVGSLADGSRVSISATIVDDQDLIWYELADHRVVPQRYLKIDQ